MFFKKLEKYKVLLASGSKRRHELLNGLKVKFEFIAQEVDESYPEKLNKHEILLNEINNKLDKILST